MLYGTQYYRSPTPLKEEWEGDLIKMKDFSLDTIQIRINWRTNERIEDQYTFDDLDELFDLAEKHNKKVVVKFLLEVAPQYIFDKYHATRIGPKGEIIGPAYHGAFYGGWMPCFTSKAVQERASKFVSTIVHRYKDRKNIILYNAWNEIRNRPIEECFCPECKRGFQNYLRNKFQTIERLNEFYGTSEESFETINLPSTPHGVWDIFEFKKYKGEVQNKEKLEFVKAAILKEDNSRPVMSHVGISASFQEHIGDCVNDHYVSQAMDLFGTSIPFEHHLNTFNERMDVEVLNDFMRSVCDHYIVHELYPGLGMFRLLYDTPYELRYKITKILSKGAKGIMFWQYRAERLAHEMDCAGLMHMNGEPKPVAYVAKEMGDFIHKYDALLSSYKEKENEIGILFDFDSSLLAEIEDMFGPDFEFKAWNPTVYYKKAHQGIYRLLRKNDYNVDYVSSLHIQNIHKYKVLFVPYFNINNAEVVKELERFVSNGGTLILDEGFLLRDENTWINPYKMKTSLFDCQLEQRYFSYENVVLGNEKETYGPYRSNYIVKDAETLATFEDDLPAIQKVNYGKGKAILLGFSLGYMAYGEVRFLDTKLLNMLLPTSVSKEDYSDVTNGLEVNALVNDHEKMTFFFNVTDQEKVVEIKEEIIENCLDGTITDNKLTIPAKSFAVIRSKK